MVTTRRVVAAGLLVVVVALTLVLLHTGHRRSGSNLVPNGAFVTGLGTGQQVCQGEELLPADTSAVRVTIGTYGRPGPPVAVTIGNARGVLTSGFLAAGWRQGVVEIPVRHVSRATYGARICLRNSGPGFIALAGDAPDPGYTLEVDGKPLGAQIRYDYMRPGRESWLEMLPAIVHRSTIAKAWFVRNWAWAAALVLMLLAVGLAARTIAREELT